MNPEAASWDDIQEARPRSGDMGLYLGDLWNLLWIDFDQDRLRKVLFESETHDVDSADWLLDLVNELVADYSISRPIPFGTNELVNFIRLWRANIVAKLDKAVSDR